MPKIRDLLRDIIHDPADREGKHITRLPDSQYVPFGVQWASITALGLTRMQRYKDFDDMDLILSH